MDFAESTSQLGGVRIRSTSTGGRLDLQHWQ
jgi:hypothetical protein